MAKRIELTEASNFLFESGSDDDDASSESSYAPDKDDCSETNDSESEDTSLESNDDVAGAQPSASGDPPQNNPQSTAAPNSIFWNQPSASFTPKFPTHEYIPCEPTVALPSTLHEIDTFKVFFPKSLCIFIAQCTNERIHLHNIKKNATIPHTDEGEVMIVLGVMFVMCYNRVPNLRDYWSSNTSMGNHFIKNAISRNRFQFLMSKLYFNKPEKPKDASKLYYVEELVNCMKHTFSNSMSESSHQSIDESMVKFKGRSVLKQYLLLKPIKRGVKVWQRCDAKTGYIFDLNVYAGKTKNDEFPEGTLGERVVTKLCSTIRISDVVISFDRFFTSVKLVGTVIKSRKNVPKFTKALEKGESEFLATSAGVVVSRWMDSKEVIVISYCSLPETTPISRKQKDGTKKQFQSPVAIALYNQIMGGVDLSDQKVNVYDFNRKSTKWWKKVFYKIQMSAAINAHILHQAVTNKKTPLLKYLVDLAEQLVLSGRKSARVKRKTNSIGGPRSKRAKALFNVGDHLPVESQGRRRCARCAQKKTDKRTKYICAACQVPLCQACFTPYHN